MSSAIDWVVGVFFRTSFLDTAGRSDGLRLGSFKTTEPSRSCPPSETRTSPSSGELGVVGVWGTDTDETEGESARSMRPQPLFEWLSPDARCDIAGRIALSGNVSDGPAKEGLSRGFRKEGAIGETERRLMGTTRLVLPESESASERVPPQIDLPSASEGDNDEMEDRESLCNI